MIRKITKNMKVHKTRRAGYVSSKLYKEATPMKFERFSDYKYILQIDGNVAAYRLAKTMLLCFNKLKFLSIKNFAFHFN